jgi:hypothetical protein
MDGAPAIPGIVQMDRSLDQNEEVLNYPPDRGINEQTQTALPANCLNRLPKKAVRANL